MKTGDRELSQSMRTGDREGSYAKMAWNQHKDATARRLDNSQGNSFFREVLFFLQKNYL